MSTNNNRFIIVQFFLWYKNGKQDRKTIPFIINHNVKKPMPKSACFLIVFLLNEENRASNEQVSNRCYTSFTADELK